MNTVYIDVLFLINFTVDYLALYLTGKTLRLPLHRWRLIVVSLAGALYALWALLWCRHYAILLSSALCVCVAVTWFAYPRTKGWHFVRNSFLFAAICAILGGSVSLMYRVLSHFLSGATMRDNGMKVLVFTLLTAVSGMLIALGNHLLTDVRGTKSVNVSICIDGRMTRFHLLVDTGNLVREPVSGKCVIFLSRVAARRAYGEHMESTIFHPERRRIITLDWGGEKRLAFSILPDRVEVDGKAVDAYVAVMPQNSLRQYDGIFPASLLA